MFACQDCGPVVYVAVILPQCLTSSHADAGDIITSHLPKWKNLRKVIVMAMNPMPMLLSTVSCGKLAEVVIRGPKHCKVSFPDLPCPGTHRGMLLDTSFCALSLSSGETMLVTYVGCNSIIAAA